MAQLITQLIHGLEWDVPVELCLALRERNELTRPWFARESAADEQGQLLAGLADRCCAEDAPALMESLRRFAHYAHEATREDREYASRQRYERAADRELMRLAGLPCRRRSGLQDEDSIGAINQPGVGQ
jgi:hypothetical protein